MEKFRTFLFGIFKKESLIGRLIDKFITKEIISYLFFGVLTTVVSFLSYALFIRIVPDSVNSVSFVPMSVAETFKIFLCNVVSWIISVLFAFITNKIFVFESRSFKLSVILKELIGFTGSRLLTGVLEWFGVPLLVKAGLDTVVFGTEGMLAKIIVSVIVVILNYVFSKIFVFKKI